MKRIVLTLLLTALAIFASCYSAFALPPFQKPWMEKYAGNDAPAEFKQAAQSAKCAICHVPGAPKVPKDGMYNDYGKAVRKFLKKRDYFEVREDSEKLQKLIDEALQRAALEPSANGKIFDDIIKAGYLP